ncbi:MAG: hypothetical protein NVS9B1_19180 [Candidatus Dormibacteraceae bacterium]
MSAGGSPLLFRPYTELRQPLPPLGWRVARWLVGAVTVLVVALCFFRPAIGLLIFWGAFVPVLPLLFLVVPGLWRNVCPMASLNQIPRTLGFTRGFTVPPAIQPYAPLISAGLFLAVIPMRHARLDRDGVALGAFLLTVLALAFFGGVLFKGKSGWCSQICPMNAVERLYGQSPLVVLANSHCRPCVGCTRNCYDFNPTAAYLADIHDTSHRLGANRMLFAGALPWVVVAFFVTPDASRSDLAALGFAYATTLLAAVAGIGFFHLLASATAIKVQKLVLLHAAIALGLFYVLAGPGVAAAWHLPAAPVTAGAGLVVLVIAAAWLARAWPREKAYVAAVENPAPQVAEHLLRTHDQASAGRAEVRFDARPAVLAAPGAILLDLAEANHVPISSGCRMGMCGADPLRVVEGADNLSPMGSSERATLERLGLGTVCRLACSAHVTGPVMVSTNLETAPGAATGHAAPAFQPDPSVRRVVVVGAGAAGVTAANEVRRLAPEADVVLIGGESYEHYNRMAVSRLVSESTSIEALYLMTPDWHSAKRIHYTRGVEVAAVDRVAATVTTQDSEVFPYDRLVLALGAASLLPPIAGFGIPGSHVLRTIDDGVDIQSYLRRHRGRRAVVVGGGLLGLELAESLTKIGIRVTVFDRGGWPLGRQLDQTAGEILGQLMAELGITILPNSTAAEVLGAERVEGVATNDGQVVPADVCVVAAGIQPTTDLAAAAGLDVGRGIRVSNRMRTSDPKIFACGDVAEVGGAVIGLWTAAVEQGRIAATNALGGDLEYRAVTPPTKLKVAALDVLSVGHSSAGEGETEVVLEEVAARRYRKLVLRAGVVVGGLIVGYPDLFDPVINAIDSGLDVNGVLTRLEAGDWSVLSPELVMLAAR